MDFVYNDLEGLDSIRLLDLEPAVDEHSELRAIIKHVCLPTDAAALSTPAVASQDPYDALSYVWGAKDFSGALQLQGGVMRITPSLVTALRYLRQASQARTLWVDQICINQDNEQEKNQQVSIMGRIYKSAMQVLVWLGEQTACSQSAISCIRDIASSQGYEAVRNDYDQYGWPSIPVLKNDSVDAQRILKLAKQNNIDDIYKRAWFTRLWPVQEVVLAQKVIVVCGVYNIEWKTLGSATIFLRAAQRSPRALIDNNFLALVDRAGIINDIRWYHGYINKAQPTIMLDNYQHFGIYMSKLRYQNCENDLDRVYALLSLRPYLFEILERNDHESPMKIEVNYRKKPFLLYREWALAMMKTGNTSFLLDAGICQRNVVIQQGHRTFHNFDPTFPKGCWDNDGEVDDDGVGHAETIRGHLAPETPAVSQIDPPLSELPSWVPDLSNKSSLMQSFPWTNVFGLNGFTARSVPEKFLQIVRLNEGEGDLPSTIWVKALLLDEIGSNFAIHQWDDSQSCTRYEYLRNVIREATRMVPPSTGDSWPIEDDSSEAFLRTIFSDGSGARCQTAAAVHEWSATERLPFNKIAEMIYFFDNPRDAMRGRPSVESVKEILSETLEGHNFFTTAKKNYIGLAPLMAKDKDVIALVDSVHVPMVLRHSKIDDEHEGFVVIGPCYVHGVMHGETCDQEGEYIPLI